MHKSRLITGNGSGLARAAAEHFAARGAKVASCGRRAEKIAEVADQIGPNCHAIRADITEVEDRQRRLHSALEHGSELDARIDNAGNMYRQAIKKIDEQQLLEVFHRNVIAAMLPSGVAVPAPVKTHGCILFVGASHTRRAFANASAYAATKASVQGLTQILAAELGDRNIRVNCVIPGGVFSQINQRGKPSDIAEAMDCVINADCTTGAILDGGLGRGVTPDARLRAEP